MSRPTPIKLYNAGLFSALAYAPNGDSDCLDYGFREVLDHRLP
jgi:hypothetical protein